MDLFLLLADGGAVAPVAASLSMPLLVHGLNPISAGLVTDAVKRLSRQYLAHRAKAHPKVAAILRAGIPFLPIISGALIGLGQYGNLNGAVIGGMEGMGAAFGWNAYSHSKGRA